VLLRPVGALEALRRRDEELRVGDDVVGLLQHGIAANAADVLDAAVVFRVLLAHGAISSCGLIGLGGESGEA
jgi:hypothetical protein